MYIHRGKLEQLSSPGPPRWGCSPGGQRAPLPRPRVVLARGMVHILRAAHIEHHILDEGMVKAAQLHVVPHHPVDQVPGQDLALRAHCVHIAHTEARILTQEYLSPVY